MFFKNNNNNNLDESKDNKEIKEKLSFDLISPEDDKPIDVNLNIHIIDYLESLKDKYVTELHEILELTEGDLALIFSGEKEFSLSDIWNIVNKLNLNLDEVLNLDLDT